MCVTIVLQLYNFVVALWPDFYKFIYWVAIVMAVLKLAKLQIKFDVLLVINIQQTVVKPFNCMYLVIVLVFIIDIIIN